MICRIFVILLLYKAFWHHIQIYTLPIYCRVKSWPNITENFYLRLVFVHTLQFLPRSNFCFTQVVNQVKMYWMKMAVKVPHTRPFAGSKLSCTQYTYTATSWPGRTRYFETTTLAWQLFRRWNSSTVLPHPKSCLNTGPNFISRLFQ